MLLYTAEIARVISRIAEREKLGIPDLTESRGADQIISPDRSEAPTVASVADAQIFLHHVSQFEGTEDVRKWLRHVRVAAECTEVSEDQLYKAMTLKLTGPAEEHVGHLRLEGKVHNLHDLQRTLLERFQHTNLGSLAQHKLNTCHQGEQSVAEFAQQIRRLSLDAVGSDVGHLENQQDFEKYREILNFLRMYHFTKGLHKHLFWVVWRAECTEFDEAVKIARHEERVLAEMVQTKVLQDLPLSEDDSGFPEVTPSTIPEQSRLPTQGVRRNRRWPKVSSPYHRSERRDRRLNRRLQDFDQRKCFRCHGTFGNHRVSQCPLPRSREKSEEASDSDGRSATRFASSELPERSRSEIRGGTDEEVAG
jgi:hypothetical protein